MNKIHNLEEGNYQIGDKTVRMYCQEHLRYNNIYRHYSPMKLAARVNLDSKTTTYVYARMLQWPEKLRSDWPAVASLIWGGNSIGLSESPYVDGEADRLWQAAALLLECYGVDHPNEMAEAAKAIKSGKDFLEYVEAVQASDRTVLVMEAFARVIEKLDIKGTWIYELVGIDQCHLALMLLGDCTLTFDRKSVELATMFVRVYQALHKLYCGDIDAMRSWFKTDCAPLYGRPNEVLGKIEILVKAMTYLEEAAFGGKESIASLVAAIDEKNMHPDIMFVKEEDEDLGQLVRERLEDPEIKVDPDEL